MPSASPIIVIMFTMKNDRSKALPTMAVAPTAAVIDTIATRIGMPAATSAPNTTTRITRATAIPIASPLSNADSPSELKTAFAVCSPKGRNWKPAGCAAASVETSSSPVESGTSLASVTVTSALWRSVAMAPVASGPCTPVTPSMPLAVAMAVATAASKPGCPYVRSSDLTTMVSVSAGGVSAARSC